MIDPEYTDYNLCIDQMNQTIKNTLFQKISWKLFLDYDVLHGVMVLGMFHFHVLFCRLSENKTRSTLHIKNLIMIGVIKYCNEQRLI